MTNLIANRNNIDNFWQGLGYFGIGAAVGAASGGLGAWASTATQAVGVFAGTLVGTGMGAVTGAATNFTLNGLNNLMQGQNFLNNWGQSVVSGLIGGGISGGISGGIQGYNNAKAQGANPWTGKKPIGPERTYSTEVKVSTLQPNPDKECYAYNIEYADKGRGNISAQQVLEANHNAPEMNIATAARDAKLKNVADIHDRIGNSLSGSEWESLGRQLQNGTTEIMGTVPIAGSSSLTAGHGVNITEIREADKLHLWGGTKTVFRGATVWDPISGTTQSRSHFFDVVWIRYRR